MGVVFDNNVNFDPEILGLKRIGELLCVCFISTI